MVDIPFFLTLEFLLPPAFSATIYTVAAWICLRQSIRTGSHGFRRIFHGFLVNVAFIITSATLNYLLYYQLINSGPPFATNFQNYAILSFYLGLAGYAGTIVMLVLVIQGAFAIANERPQTVQQNTPPPHDQQSAVT